MEDLISGMLGAVLEVLSPVVSVSYKTCPPISRYIKENSEIIYLR